MSARFAEPGTGATPKPRNDCETQTRLAWPIILCTITEAADRAARNQSASRAGKGPSMSHASQPITQQHDGFSAKAAGLAGRSVVTLDDLSLQQLMFLIFRAEYIAQHPDRVSGAADGKLLATLFYEPSTRTRLSFESAMLRLGGHVIGFMGAKDSSVSKGETVHDTLRAVSGIADIAVMRHPKDGAAAVGSQAAAIPVVNGGDGGHLHPTQTLADLLTIWARCGSMTGLTIGVCGDLLHGRTVHSLVETMTRFGNNKFVFIAPDELQMPQYVCDRVDASENCSRVRLSELRSAIADLDVLYMTRVQRERFASQEAYLRLRDTYVLTRAKLANAKGGLAVLHPLPRFNEIARDVDAEPCAAYFDQVHNGMLMRMALISSLLGLELPGFDDAANCRPVPGDKPIVAGMPTDAANAARLGLRCGNKRCITDDPREARPSFYLASDSTGEEPDYRCAYCDMKCEPHGDEDDAEE